MNILDITPAKKNWPHEMVSGPAPFVKLRQETTDENGVRHLKYLAVWLEHAPSIAEAQRQSTVKPAPSDDQTLERYHSLEMADRGVPGHLMLIAKAVHDDIPEPDATMLIMKVPNMAGILFGLVKSMCITPEDEAKYSLSSDG